MDTVAPAYGPPVNHRASLTENVRSTGTRTGGVTYALGANGLTFGPRSGPRGAAAFRIVALLLGIKAAELQVRPGIPVLLKKRDLLELNDIEVYLGQLAARVQREG